MNIQWEEANKLMEFFFFFLLLAVLSITASNLISYIFYPLGIYFLCEVT